HLLRHSLLIDGVCDDSMCLLVLFSFTFFLIDTSPFALFTLSLHDALPIFFPLVSGLDFGLGAEEFAIWFGILVLVVVEVGLITPDRKSTRLNSSHVKISYAVFCLKKKKQTVEENRTDVEKHNYVNT